VQNTLRWNCVSLQISQNRAGGILTQICGNNFMVLKVAPPLIVSEQQLEEFVVAICFGR
jgi:4-aminobutyrate aminotransferase-like enzyme